MLEVFNVTKRYQKFTAVTDVSFTVNAGEIVGLIGPNGAGKTTILRTCVGIITPTQGDVVVNGFSIKREPRQAKSQMAFVPEVPNLYEMLTVMEHVRFSALAYGTMDGFTARSEELLRRFDLWDKRKALTSSLSKGMRQKVAVVCAFIHHANVLLFDEPLIGIDPTGVRELKNMLYNARDEGCTILISTHLLDSVERLCDRVIILQKGQKLLEGSLSELHAKLHLTSDTTLEDIYLQSIGYSQVAR